MLLGDLGWGRLVHLQSALGAAAQGPAVPERSRPLWCPDGQNPGHGESTLTSLLPLLETAPGSINIVISIIQMVALGVATMDKFISFSENTRVSSFFPDCNTTGKSESRTHEHGTYSVQMPTKTRTSRCRFLGINEETKAVTSVVSPKPKSHHRSCWRSLAADGRGKAEPLRAPRNAWTQTSFLRLKPPRSNEGPALMRTILLPREYVSNENYSKGFSVFFPEVFMYWNALRLLSCQWREETGLM